MSDWTGIPIATYGASSAGGIDNPRVRDLQNCALLLDVNLDG
jgi:hypothetical protein